jgi:hypothetical protein
METITAILHAEGLRNFAILIGVLVAMVSIATARSLARKKQAADLLFQSRSIKELQLAAQCIEKHHNANDSNMRALANGSAQTEESALIRSLLNHFELISVGIQSGIYDERMIKESWCTIVTRTYDQALPFIQATRERDNKQTLYQEFELLAKRWKDCPLTAKRSWGQSWWRRFV